MQIRKFNEKCQQTILKHDRETIHQQKSNVLTEWPAGRSPKGPASMIDKINGNGEERGENTRQHIVLATPRKKIGQQKIRAEINHGTKQPEKRKKK